MKRRPLLLALLTLPITKLSLAEVSAVLELRLEDLTGEPLARRIIGDGHSHTVMVGREQQARLLDEGTAIVESAPATPNGHRHFVRVTLRA